MVDQPDRRAAAWQSAAEAARALGVQRRSLYAYVSRGQVRSVAGVGGRERLYSTEDLERLRVRRDARAGHGPVAAGALQFGEAVLDSAITEITPEGPCYRGYLARELAEHEVPFENVAELLWSGALCDGAVRWPRPRAAATTSRSRRRGATVADELIEATLQLGHADPERGDLRADAVARCGRTLIPALAIACHPAATARDRQRAAAQPSVAAMVAAAWRLPASAVAVVEAALVVLADHELNASTFAARVTASTGADPYAVVVAALAALSGPRHGTAALEAGQFLAEVGRPSQAAAAVRALRAVRRVPPGFGHRAYAGVDPRALPLLALADRLAATRPGSQRLVHTAHALIDAVGEDGTHPNVDLALVAVAAALGAPFEVATAWFAVGRCAGWLAHAVEQRTLGTLLRPRARYVGVPRRAVEYRGELAPRPTPRPRVR